MKNRQIVGLAGLITFGFFLTIILKDVINLFINPNNPLDWLLGAFTLTFISSAILAYVFMIVDSFPLFSLIAIVAFIVGLIIFIANYIQAPILASTLEPLQITSWIVVLLVTPVVLLFDLIKNA